MLSTTPLRNTHAFKFTRVSALSISWWRWHFHLHNSSGVTSSSAAVSRTLLSQPADGNRINTTQWYDGHLQTSYCCASGHTAEWKYKNVTDLAGSSSRRLWETSSTSSFLLSHTQSGRHSRTFLSHHHKKKTSTMLNSVTHSELSVTWLIQIRR